MPVPLDPARSVATVSDGGLNVRVARRLASDSTWHMSMASSVALHATAIAGLYAGSWWWLSGSKWEVIPPEWGVNSAASVERRVLEVAAPTASPAEASTEALSLAAAAALPPSELAPRVIEVSPVGTLPPPEAPMPEDQELEVAALATQTDVATDRTTTAVEEVAVSELAAPSLDRRDRTITPTTLASAQAEKIAPRSSTPSVASNPSRGALGLPSAIFNPTPVYPPHLMAARVEGVVKLRVELDDQGRVVRATVSKPSGQAAFDRAALDVIYRWRFTSSSARVPTQRTLIVPIRFGIVE